MLKRYLEIKEEIGRLNKEKLDIEKKIYIENKSALENVEEGTKRFTMGDFKVSVVKKLTYSVDQELADTMSFGFKKKYSFDKKAFNDLTEDQQKEVNQCLTTKGAKPSFTVEAL